jgi:quinohemoprotein amine dehydrogenase alpha subunit-like protein/WD40 repeat protein
MSVSARSRHSLARVVAVTVLAAGLGAVPFPEALAVRSTLRVSLAPDKSEGNSHSLQTALSMDGRWLAFASLATNLVDGDTNGSADVFVLDRRTGTITRASVGAGGVEAERGGSSLGPSISADGRFVAFESAARNLVTGDNNGVQDVFVHDSQTGTTVRASVNSGGSEADKDSRAASISGDGRFVAFQSNATNLVANDTNSTEDIFVFDRQTGQTTRVSVGPGGAQAESAANSNSPSISGDGRHVAFVSAARNLVAADTNSDKNGATDVFVHDRQSGTTTNVSVASDGTPANFASERPVISADGRVVAFDSIASTLVAGDTGSSDVFVHDLGTRTTTRVSVAADGSQADASSRGPALSADGNVVAFESDAKNLVSGDTNSTDVFVHDRQANTTTRVSVATDGTEGNDRSLEASISGDARYVAFHSYAKNLVEGDLNDKVDVFVRTPDLPAVASASPVGLRPGTGDTVITVKGSGFSPTTELNFGPGVTVKKVAFVSGNQLDVTVTVASDAALGTRDIVLMNPDGDQTTCPKCFTVKVAGFWMVASDGGVFSVGDAKFLGSTGAVHLNKPIVGMTASRSGSGYWMVASDGGIFSFGDAKFFGSTGNIKLNQPIVGMAATPSGAGYWLVASDGGIFSFGDAKFFGSTGDIKLNKPIVGMSATPSGKGYWMVASDGGIFSFGDAKFFGSTGNITLNKPITAMTATPTAGGYWMTASDGGIFAFGDAKFFGSTGAQRAQIAAMVVTPSGSGYWLVGSDGAVFPFGDAAALTSGAKPNKPIVGAGA